MIRKKDLLKKIIELEKVVKDNEILCNDPLTTKRQAIFRLIDRTTQLELEIKNIEKTRNVEWEQSICNFKNAVAGKVNPIQKCDFIQLKTDEKPNSNGYQERMELLIKWNVFDYKKKLKNTKLKAEFEEENKTVLEKLKEYDIEKITFDEIQDLEISFRQQLYKQELINKYKEN